jgi:hypothetical protein
MVSLFHTSLLLPAGIATTHWHVGYSQRGKTGIMNQWQHWRISSQDVIPFENRPDHQPSTTSIR